MSNSTTIVPLVLWGKKAPTHTISVIKCTCDQKTIITGTLHGQIGLWDLRHIQNGGLKVVPRNLIFAHGAKIVDIACALDASFNRPNVVSLAENGELCLWDIEDGLCLQMNQIVGNHTGFYSVQVPRGSIKEWRLVLYGCYSDIYVLDSLSLQVLYTLRSRVSPDWISAVCVLRPVRKKEGGLNLTNRDDQLIALNVSSVVKVWTLKPSHESRNEVIYEEESKTLDCLKAKSMCANPFTNRTMLVISSQVWQIFDASDFNFLAALPAPYKIPLTDGDFVATNRVLVWNKRGKAFLYKLPSRYLLGAEQMSGKKDFLRSDEVSRLPTLICEFEECGNKMTFDFPTSFSYGRRGPYYKLLIQGVDGGVCIWKVPDSEQADMLLSKLKVEPTDQPQTSEVTVSDEGVRKTILLDEPVARIVKPFVNITLKELWDKAKPAGLIAEMREEGSLPPSHVTSSLYIPSQGKMVCGRSNGTIVIVDAIKTAMAQLLHAKNETGSSPNVVLYGHIGHVTCLLYPHDENPRYDQIYLISGGSDFTVRAWNIKTGTLAHTFSCHGGEVLRLLVTPAECNSRFLSCICSVGQDHSVSLVGLRDRKVVLLASRHTFPVETIRWRPKDDFMVVGCSDGTVYVWQMETGRIEKGGHLDRCVAGAIALEILESCHEETSAPSLAVREHHRKFKLHHHLTNMAHHIPIDIKAPQVVRKMKNRVASLHQQVTGSQKNAPGNQASRDDKSTTQVPLPPMRVCALRTSIIDPDIHVILLDPEALIRQLLTEEAHFFASKASPINVKRGMVNPNIMDKRYNTNTVSYEIAQLLLSCIHAWGLDIALDSTCVSKLGMLKPLSPLSFGLLTRGRLTLMFPDWYVSGEEEIIAGALEAGEQPEEIGRMELDEEETKKIKYNAHWQLSSSLTTQHLVSTVAVTNTLMGMNYVSFNQQEQKSRDSKSLEPPSPTGSMMRAEVKAGWSLLAALHCCMLPDAMAGLKYRPPLLHILARRWQDRCLEIREAAQAVLLAELRRIGPLGRKQLIDAWSPHLPQDIENDFGFEDLEQYINNEEGEKQILVTAEEDRTDIAMVMMTTRKMVSSDIKLRHATAIIMLGVIGAEFQKEIDPINRESKYSSYDSCMDVNVVRSTAKALTTLLLQRQSSKTPAYSAIRRAAIDLIGRGFALWEHHIDVSQVLMGFFELCADIENQIKERPAGRNFSMAAAKDLHRSAKHSLSLIATARPSACITTLAKEVARHVASTSSMSFTQPSPAAIAVYSHVRHPQSTGESQHSNILHNTRSEILRIMELMIDKNQQQVVEFIVEVVDIIVHMLDFKQMKERGLAEVFPSLFKFPMVAYCSNTRRLAVGSRLGHIVLYELRSSRCQLIPAHESPISALAFSPEGKVLASFCYNDKKISFYQTSSSLLGMLSSTIKCIQTYTTLLPNDPQAAKSVRILWTSKKNIVLALGDGSQHKYSI